MSRALDLAVIPWGILGSGVLSGKDNKDPKTSGRFSKTSAETIDERSLEIAQEVCVIAEELNASPSQMAIAWLLKGPANIIPLIGAQTVSQWNANSGCLDVKLSEEHMIRLNKISSIDLGFPNNFVKQAYKFDSDRGVVNHRAWNVGGYWNAGNSQ